MNRPAISEMIRRFWPLLVLVVVAGLATALIPRKHEKRVDDSVTTVSAMHPLPRTLVQELDVTGELKPFQQIDVFSLVAGYVKSIPVDIGDHLKAGDVIATLEVLDMDQQMAAIRAGKKGLDAPLPTSKGTDASRGPVTTTTIIAPFDGVVTKRNADNGTLVQTGVYSSTQSIPLVSLAQNDLLRACFLVPETAIAMLKIGEEIRIHIPLLKRTIQGKIARFSKLIASASRTMEVQVDILNPELTITPGLYAVGTFPVAKATDAVSIPVQALRTPDDPTVYAISVDGILERRAVQLGVETPEWVQVVSGLESNDLVVMGNASELEPGMKVSPRIAETAPTATLASGPTAGK